MEQKQQNKKLLSALIVYCAVFVAVLLIANIDAFRLWMDGIMLILRPVLIGLVLAYLANPFFRFFERKLFYKLRPAGLRRTVALLCTYLALTLILVVLILLIVPQLISNLQNFFNTRDAYFRTTVNEINGLIDFLNQKLPAKADGSLPVKPLAPDAISNAFDKLIGSLRFDSNRIMEMINPESIGTLWNAASGLIKLLADIVIGIFISVYLLHSKEKRYAQIMRFRRSVFSDKVNETITRICSTADRSFGGFLKGKILDSMIVGVLVYITISIFDVPYAILIATIVAITDIVPIIGPFIGVIPSAVLILLIDPPKVIIFLICILVIQQIDGNIIAPKILGENTGVSSLCVLISIITMGAIWGFAGMVLGVPLFATVLELTSDALDKRLQKKGLPTETEIYQSAELITASATKLQGRRRRRTRAVKDPALCNGEGNLSAHEQESLALYARAKECGLLSDRSDAALARFAERSADNNEVSANEDTSQKSSETSNN